MTSPNHGKVRTSNYLRPPDKEYVKRTINNLRSQCELSVESLERSVIRYRRLPKVVHESKEMSDEHRTSCSAFLSDGDTMYGGMLEALLESVDDAEKVLEEGSTGDAQQMAANTAGILQQISNEVSLLSQAVNAHEREMKRLNEIARAIRRA